MNHPRSAGAFVTQRFQRIAFQRWLQRRTGRHPGRRRHRRAGRRPAKEHRRPDRDRRPAARHRAPAGATPVTFARPALSPSVAGASGVVTQPDPGTAHRAPGLRLPGGPADPGPAPAGHRPHPGSGLRLGQAAARLGRLRDDRRGVPRQGPNCLELTVNGTPQVLLEEPARGAGRCSDDAGANGLNVLLSVVRAPDFYAAPGGHSPCRPARRCGDFLQFLVPPALQGQGHAVEPWNEQNLSWEWGGARLWPNAPAAPPQGVVEFVRLQQAAYRGVKAADPAVTVVLPALTPTGLGECWRRSRRAAQRGLRRAGADRRSTTASTWTSCTR